MMEIISSLTTDLEKIKEDAQSVHSCLTEHVHTTGKHSVVCFSLILYVSAYCVFFCFVFLITHFYCVNLCLCRSPPIREAAAT